MGGVESRRSSQRRMIWPLSSRIPSSNGGFAPSAESGADRYDEVWEGIYMMTPAPNLEHQKLVFRLADVLDSVIGKTGLGDVYPEVNVSDREDDWTQNFREPDVVVVLQGGREGLRDALVRRPRLPDRDHRPPRPRAGEIGVLRPDRRPRIVDRRPRSVESGTLSTPQWETGVGKPIAGRRANRCEE